MSEENGRRGVGDVVSYGIGYRMKRPVYQPETPFFFA